MIGDAVFHGLFEQRVLIQIVKGHVMPFETIGHEPAGNGCRFSCR
jgi:hypothetical protein